MSDFTDNNEDKLTELFDELSSHGGDSDALETYLCYLDDYGTDDMGEAEDAISNFDDNYRGTAKSEADFAEELSEEVGDLANVPDWIKSCIDWDDVWSRNLCYDVNSHELPSGRLGFVWIH